MEGDANGGTARVHSQWRAAGSLYLLVAAGLLLRVIILFAAEDQLDCDEAVIALMGLDILDGARPFFFYHTTYNGGGALEGYLAAIGFRLFGPSAIVVKMVILFEWTIAALLFAGLCRRALRGGEALLALLFFIVATPFFLEWSVKARGGYIETLMIEILLLYLALPPKWIRRCPPLASISFGVAFGIGVWFSEMILPMAIPALLWFYLQRGPLGLRKTSLQLALGTFIGLLPLLLYNLTHNWINLKQSALSTILADPESPMLTIDQMAASLKFILGPLWWFGLIVIAVGLVSLIARRRTISLAHILLLHAALYLTGYCLEGLRYLEIPPARILFPLLPALAVLLAHAASWAYGEGRSTFRRLATTTGIVIWIAGTTFPVYHWIRSGEPREVGSWRGTWSLVDGIDLYKVLAEERTDIAFVSYWTCQSLEFGKRLALLNDNSLRNLRISFAIPPDRYNPGSRAAFVLLTESPLLEEIVARLNLNRVHHRRREWQTYTILSEIDTGFIHTGAGFPPTLTRESAFPPMPLHPGGFN